MGRDYYILINKGHQTNCRTNMLESDYDKTCYVPLNILSSAVVKQLQSWFLSQMRISLFLTSIAELKYPSKSGAIINYQCLELPLYRTTFCGTKEFRDI